MLSILNRSLKSFLQGFSYNYKYYFTSSYSNAPSALFVNPVRNRTNFVIRHKNNNNNNNNNF